MLLAIVAACYAALRVVLTLGLLRRPPRVQQQPSISIVVAARDEAESLRRLLPALLAQDYPDYEVIIVDDRSSDATPALLSDWQERDPRLIAVRIDELPEGRTPKMYALGEGIARSRGELLLLTDADCRVPSSWAAAMAAMFTPEVGAAIGYVDLYAAHGTLLEQLQAFDYFTMMAMTAGATQFGHPLGGAGANLAYRRAAYDQVGGFAAMPSGAVADDMLLVQRVLSQTDWRVTFCDDPRAFIATAAEPTLAQLIQQRTRWIAGGREVLQQNKPLLISSALIGTLNGMLLFWPLWLRRRDLRGILLLSVVVRVLADLLHFGVAAVRFRRVALLRYLPLWMIVQPPYMVGLPLASIGKRWSWKGTENREQRTENSRES
jgi:cellulose synthase/poly-beta-1,6-N-acetylglucosamine synthase-like glycosyltransferase